MNPKKLLIAAIALTCGVAPAAKSFYKEPPLFSMAPKTDKSVQVIARFGPVGMAIELHHSAFVMHVGKIEEGSPAATSGLKAGQIIEKAEAKDGVLKFLVTDKPNAKAQDALVRIPALGACSKSWPLNCPKTEKIALGDSRAGLPEAIHCKPEVIL